MLPPSTNQSALIDASQHANKIDLVILDGGFGTTLETLFSQDISGPLWSARLIDTNPKLVVDAHLAFLHSGADVILTSTYQCSYSTFSRAGYTRADAEANMRKAVTLANDARDRYLAEQAESVSKSMPKIALSLGSFGATLPGGEEFGGFYPPPYGPPGKINTFSKDQSASEEASIRALTEFYLERLRVFLPVLDSVDYVAFETVPLRREIRAIRRAMNAFLQEKRPAVDSNGDTGIVKWWISTVWPDGLYPEVNQDGERDTSAKDVVEALLGSREGEARPWGVGINCTFVDHLHRIVREMEDALQDLEGPTLSSHRDSPKEGEDVTASKPWLVVYPNGGDIYDGHTQTWITNKEGKGERWANRVWKVVEGAIERAVWGGVVVGGCCRTGPDEISGLVELRSQKERSR